MMRNWTVAALLAILCGPTIAQPQPSLSIAVPRSPLSLPLYVAQSEGMFDAAGIRVQITDCASGMACLDRVLKLTSDVAATGDVPITFAAFRTPDFVVIGTIATTFADLKVVVRRDSSITGPASVIGKRIGVVFGTTSHYALDSYLLKNGFDPRLVVMVAMQPGDMLEAMQSRRVDGVSSWEPYGFRIMQTMGHDVLALPNTGVYSVLFNLVAHRDLVGARDKDLSLLLLAVEQAEKFIRAHPEQAKAILRKRLELDDAFVTWVWPQQVFRLSLEWGLLRTLESESRWAIREGYFRGIAPPDFGPFLYRPPLNAVNPSAIKLP